MAAVPIIKTCMMGGGGQGKSALVLQFITGTFLTDYDPTIEDTYRKNVTVNDETALIEILDTAGQEVFWSMQEQWIRDSQIFYLVYSITSRDGFKTIDLLRNRIMEVKATRDIPMILVGTHSDLSTERMITIDQAQQKATAWDCDYIEVSALTTDNIEELFNLVIPLYHKYYGNGINALSEEIEHQQSKTGCCSTICGADNDDIDDIEIEIDSDGERKKKNFKIQFFKNDDLPPDMIPSPILSLKNFRIARQFYWGRFFKAGLHGIFVPIVVIFQTFCFLTYSEKTDPSFYPENYPYHEKFSLLWDYLGMVVGRKPGQDPEAIKDRKWFLRQTAGQKLKRVLITIIVCVVFGVCCYNISQVNNQEFKVSLMESAGPFVLFWIVWLLLSVWIGYEQRLKPDIPAPTRLRSLPIFFGEDFSHRSSVYKFVRAFESSRTNNRWKLSKPRTFIVICLGLIYAMTPGLTRLTFGDSSESQRGTFFSTDGNYVVELGALIVNFVLISTFIYCVEIQFKKQFDNYREWMSDLTMLLYKSDNDELKDKDDDYEKTIKGSAFSKDLFISLTRRQNALGWLEIRSFLAVQGQVLFGEQELPTLWMLLISCALAIFCLYRAYFRAGNPVESILFNGLSILTVICVVALFRILLTAYQFEGIQIAQEKLIAEQKFFMRCNRPYDDLIIDSHAVGLLETQKSQQSKPNLIQQNPLHKDSIIARNDDDNNFEVVNDTNNDILNEENEEKEEEEDNKDKEVEMVPSKIKDDDDNVDGTATTIKLKYDDSYNVDSDNNEHAPLLNRKNDGLENEDDPLVIVKNKVTKIDDVNRYSYNIAFVEDALILVHKKDIFPRLFKLKLNSFLSKIVIGLVICCIVTAFKLFID